jgi:cardiolipin synthase
MALKFYKNSVLAWDAMLQGIESAKRSIYIEMYSFSNDTESTHDFVKALSDKAKAGVEVVMILDAFGSMNLSDEVINNLQNSGVQVLFFHHFFNRTHRKLVVVDGSIAFLGGANISENSRKWFDLQVQGGKRVAQRLVRVFARTYKFAGGKKILRERGTKKEKNTITSYIIEHTPVTGRRHLRKYYEDKISHASSSIILITPYFVPSKWFYNSIHNSIKRGVRVDILIPKSTDHIFLDTVNTYMASRYRELGCYIHLLSEMNHAKAILIDEKEGMVGSGNLDNLSFQRNSELGIFFKDINSVKSLSKILHEWIIHSEEFNDSKHSLTWYEKIAMPFIRILFPFL